jgi:hypothetical protein
MASAQNRVSGLLNSEMIRPSPSGGSKPFRGSSPTFPTGTAGKIALHTKVTPNKKSVIRTQKYNGRPSANRFTNALPYPKRYAQSKA